MIFLFGKLGVGFIYDVWFNFVFEVVHLKFEVLYIV